MSLGCSEIGAQTALARYPHIEAAQVVRRAKLLIQFEKRMWGSSTICMIPNPSNYR